MYTAKTSKPEKEHTRPEATDRSRTTADKTEGTMWQIVRALWVFWPDYIRSIVGHYLMPLDPSRNQFSDVCFVLIIEQLERIPRAALIEGL